jgi:hypothetical protein
MTLKAEDYVTRRERVGPFEINIMSYRLGDTYYCSVDNVDPGAVVARADGATRAEAEGAAVKKARQRVEKTRIASVQA